MTYRYTGDDCVLICAALDVIRKELDRCYWNKYQKEMVSPFDNTGAEYSNDTFSVYAYYWGDDEKLIHRPNFTYKDLTVSWYKHSNRGATAKCSHRLRAEDLTEMIVKCKQSIVDDFKGD